MVVVWSFQFHLYLTSEEWKTEKKDGPSLCSKCSMNVNIGEYFFVCSKDLFCLKGESACSMSCKNMLTYHSLFEQDWLCMPKPFLFCSRWNQSSSRDLFFGALFLLSFGFIVFSLPSLSKCP
jgi:hypothetical protein